MKNELKVSLVIIRLEIDDLTYNTTDLKNILEYKCKLLIKVLIF